MQGSGFRVQGAGFRFQDSGFRAQGSRWEGQRTVSEEVNRHFFDVRPQAAQVRAAPALREPDTELPCIHRRWLVRGVKMYESQIRKKEGGSGPVDLDPSKQNYCGVEGLGFSIEG